MLYQPSFISEEFSKPAIFIGLMSGTSLDGVDAVIALTDGKDEFKVLHSFFYPFSTVIKTLTVRAIKAAKAGLFKSQDIDHAEKALTDNFILVIKLLMDDYNEKNPMKLEFKDILAIALHGQTIEHISKRQNHRQAFTWQLGNAEIIAKEFSTAVIYDFRKQDISMGGEGAPLAPIYHYYLMSKLKVTSSLLSQNDNIAVINIGGVANITFIGKYSTPSEMIAFDCGPGNGLLDQWVKDKCNIPFDKNGMVAKKGNVHAEIVKQYLSNGFFQINFPKSLDRYDFSLNLIELLTNSDGAATLSELSVQSMVLGLQQIERKKKLHIDKIILCGGGRKNEYLVRQLKLNLHEYGGGQVLKSEEIGLQGDFIEAECFAYLAARAIKNYPISFPLTTGVLKAVVGGKLAIENKKP